MFEHLDDPRGIDPGGRELHRVLERAEALRGRRRITMPVTLGLVFVLLGASLALVGLGLGPRSSSSDTAYQFELRTGPLPVGTPVPTTALFSVHFASATEGFALALHRGRVLLAASNDGGSTWQVRNNHLPPSGLAAENGLSGQFEFVGSDGYLWGLRTEASAPLWVTHDEGLTWRRASIGPDVVDVSAIGLDAWALVRRCPATADSLTSSACAVVVEVSLDGGSTWRAAPVEASDIVGASQVSASPPPELARITDDRAYVLTASPGAGGITTWRLLFTEDAAASWSIRSAPCTGAYALGAEVAASSTGDLWLLCGGQATAGSQSKQLYRSGDGGLSWQLRASASGLGTPPPATVPQDPLPLAGYVAPFSIGHRNLAVLSRSAAWIFPSRSDLLKTSDGGSSWVPVPSLASAGFDSGGAGNVTFLSATQGWICEYGVGLWHTDDGTTWSPLGSP
jgi:photosystem II stability/assembly factor-like uncharacterized protein